MRVSLDIDNASDPPSLIIGTPEQLFLWQYSAGTGARRHHDLSPDGRRFLMITRVGTAGAELAREEIKIVVNWFEELRTRVPVP